MCVREESWITHFSFFDVQSMGSPLLYARGLRGLFGLPTFWIWVSSLIQLFLTVVRDLPFPATPIGDEALKRRQLKKGPQGSESKKRKLLGGMEENHKG